MKIAYLILAHANPNQLKRLVHRLHAGNARIYIHLDNKTANVQDFFDIAREFPDIAFIAARVDVKWGSFSVVQAILNSLRQIMCSGEDYDYINLLSGMDYPIKSTEQINAFFRNNQGREFIHYRSLPIYEFPEGRMDRVWYYYDFDNINNAFGSHGSGAYEIEMRKRGLKRSFIDGMKPYHGSMWWCLTGKCIKHILDMVEYNKDIINFFRYTKFPDEQFFQTLVMNSPYAVNAPSENLWYLDWSIPGQAHPKTLDSGDFCKLKSSDALFARKLNESVDCRLFNMIDELLLM